MLCETVQSDVLTVSAYAARLVRALRGVGGALIEGEVQKPKRSTSGTLWFSVTDGDAVLPCKVFSKQVGALSHIPREGDLVRIEVDRPDLWQQAGKLDLIVSQISLAGEGELLRRRQALIARLGEEGLCDPARRRPLPRFPRAVGVIAGRDSEAMNDAVQALVDRWPAVHVVTCDSLVQGKRAPRDLVDALAHMVEHPLVDVVIVTRGGGSVQDLACFDDESLCRALFACELPVVCAIGHTDNNPVCNHVAWAAYTPSRSAEMVVPCAAELRSDIAAARDRLDGVRGRLSVVGERLERASERVSCAAALDAREGSLRQRADAVEAVLHDFLLNHEHGLERARHRLDATPDRAALELGVEHNGLLAMTAALARAGERVERVAANVRTLGETVRAGTRRQADDHARDYGRALARLAREARAGLDRRVGLACELVGRKGAVLGERVRRRLGDARRGAGLRDVRPVRRGQGLGAGAHDLSQRAARARRGDRARRRNPRVQDHGDRFT